MEARVQSILAGRRSAVFVARHAVGVEPGAPPPPICWPLAVARAARDVAAHTAPLQSVQGVVSGHSSRVIKVGRSEAERGREEVSQPDNHSTELTRAWEPSTTAD